MRHRHWHSPIRALLTGLLMFSGFAAALWFFLEGQVQQRQSAADIAQLKLSLELYGRQYTATATSMADVTSTLGALEERVVSLEASLASTPAVSARSVDALERRLSALEGNPQPQQPVETVAIPVPRPTSQAPAPAPRTDCVSPNSPFLVAAGDIFPVCGTSGWVAVSEVGQQRISFANGSAAYVGRSIALEGTTCMLTVRSANAAWLAGYGEVQVTC